MLEPGTFFNVQNRAYGSIQQYHIVRVGVLSYSAKAYAHVVWIQERSVGATSWSRTITCHEARWILGLGLVQTYPIRDHEQAIATNLWNEYMRNTRKIARPR